MEWFLVYCAGLALTTGIMLGANAYAKEMEWEEPVFDWGSRYDDGDAKMKYVTGLILWPVAWAAFAIRRGFISAARASKRRIAAREEYRRILESPIAIDNDPDPHLYP